MRRRRIMREGFKADKILMNEHDNVLNLQSHDKETETKRMLDALFTKIKFEKEEDTCNFKDSCYTAKYKMGPCPCELYR
jgi:hypothetical protein